MAQAARVQAQLSQFTAADAVVPNRAIVAELSLLRENPIKQLLF